MAFPYKHVVVVGATSGIGKAMADRLIEGGAKVTAVGRRKDRLQEFVKKHGEEKAQAEPFDILNHEQIQQFAKEYSSFTRVRLLVSLRTDTFLTVLRPNILILTVFSSTLASNVVTTSPSRKRSTCQTST